MESTSGRCKTEPGFYLQPNGAASKLFHLGPPYWLHRNGQWSILGGRVSPCKNSCHGKQPMGDKSECLAFVCITWKKCMLRISLRSFNLANSSSFCLLTVKFSANHGCNHFVLWKEWQNDKQICDTVWELFRNFIFSQHFEI